MNRPEKVTKRDEFRQAPLMLEAGKDFAAGHKMRVQESVAAAHCEMDCNRKAGRRAGYEGVTIHTTVSCCLLCSGRIVQFAIKRVVFGEERNFRGNIRFLREHDVEVMLLQDERCEALMSELKRKDLICGMRISQVTKKIERVRPFSPVGPVFSSSAGRTRRRILSGHREG